MLSLENASDNQHYVHAVRAVSKALPGLTLQYACCIAIFKAMCRSAMAAVAANASELSNGVD